MIATGRFRICALAVVIACGDVPAHSGLSLAEQAALAMRFRPYIKTTLDEGRDEPFHPSSWQWFIAHADLHGWNSWDPPLVTAHMMNTDHLQLVLPANAANVRVGGAGLTDPYLQLHLVDAQSRAGESWDLVIHEGHGIYAHVEEVNDQIINIEYTILWTYNAAIGSHHDGDLTTMTVVYDRGADLLTRVTYLIHGCIIEAFGLDNPVAISFRQVLGRTETFDRRTIIPAKLSINAHNTHQHSTSCGKYCSNGVCHSPSDSYILLAKDPVSLLYEHPLAFAEEGAHELWPNGTGSVWTAPDHGGSGVSFLPDTVEVLGTLKAPNPVHYPFIFYNGRFGTDPQAIVLHRAWFWPEGRANNRYEIPPHRFTDRDPYQQNGNLAWPPPAYTNGPTTVYVAPRQVLITYVDGTPFDGSLNSPFPDPMTAASFLPSGGVIDIAAGTYSGPAVFSRAATIVSRGGPVTIGGW